MATVREEDYLEAILHVVNRKGYARVGDIAKALNCSSATVTGMFGKLSSKGFVNYEKYGGVTLTESGRSLAGEVAMRHGIIKSFLVILGVEEGIADQDACEMEHNLHPVTLQKLDKFLEFTSKCPSDTCWLLKYREFLETGEIDFNDCPREMEGE